MLCYKLFSRPFIPDFEETRFDPDKKKRGKIENSRKTEDIFDNIRLNFMNRNDLSVQKSGENF